MENNDINGTDFEKKTDPNQNVWQKNGTEEKVSHKIGDAIEHAGDFVGDKISKTVGDKIHNLGDKIEHSQD